MAVVGGINTMVIPDGHVSFSKAGMLSPDGPLQDVLRRTRTAMSAVRAWACWC